MTSTTANPARPADLPAAHSVDEFVFSVPDLEEASRFYTSFGLDVRDEGSALALYTHDHPHRWARVVPGKSKRLLWLSLGMPQGTCSKACSVCACPTSPAR